MAPEPNDIYWENLHVEFYEKQGKIIFTWFLLFLTLAASFGLLYSIGAWQNDLNDSSKD